MRKIAYYFLPVIVFLFSCHEDPILDEVDHFLGTYIVDSIRTVDYQIGTTDLFTDEAEFLLKKRKSKDTISAFGEVVVVEPGVDENQLFLTKNLNQFEFIRVCSNYSSASFDESGEYYIARWFPDLNKQRLTFWTITGSGQYRVVLTVSGSGDRQQWTYVRASPLGGSSTQSSLLYKEVVYVRRR